MIRSTFKLTTIFTVAIVTLFASQANADIYDRIDRYAVKIQKKTKSLLGETIHYRHTPQYRQLVQCTQELSRLAAHIHDVTHFEGNLLHLRADLKALDAEFCLLEGFFDKIEYAASRGYGHVKGNTAHVKSLLNSIERNIHHISDDVEKLVAAKVAYRKPVVVKKQVVVKKPVVVTKPVYPVRQSGISINIGSKNRGYGQSRSRGRGYGGGGFGISIGGGSSKIVFGF